MKRIVTILNDIKETDWNLRGVPGYHSVTHVGDCMGFDAYVPLQYVHEQLTEEMLLEINLLRKKVLEAIHSATFIYLSELNRLGIHAYQDCVLTRNFTIDHGDEYDTYTFSVEPFISNWWEWGNKFFYTEGCYKELIISLPLKFHLDIDTVVKMGISNFTDKMLTIVANDFFKEAVAITTNKKVILIETDKPGVIIGKKGCNINRFKDMLKEHSVSLGNKRIEVKGI